MYYPLKTNIARKGTRHILIFFSLVWPSYDAHCHQGNILPECFLWYIASLPCQGLVSDSFLSFFTHPLQTDVSCFSCVLLSFFLSFFFFFFLSTEHISWTIEPILMKLGHNNHWTSPHIWHDIWPRYCPLGVTGVKKVILAKIHQLLQFT